MSRVVKIAAIRKIMHVTAAGIYSRLSSGKYSMKLNIYETAITQQPFTHKMLYQLLYHNKQGSRPQSDIEAS
ncbi:hypothetical protein ACNR9V_03435 [Parageobacillus thermoglucosidasius]|uniref:hypothetical protein n=1 Tax=Parageobacillus thermoglucosidasius TaxID=1426 RepID=UPI003B67ACE2